MKINTLSQNNPAFGVRMSIKEATISKLRNQIAEKPQLPADGSIFGRIYYKIMNTKQKDSSLISFFQDITRRSSEFIGLLEKSGKTLERAFWETCNKFFDVQLVANDEDTNINNISDDKIEEDSYLTKIFHPIKNIKEKRKQIIEYCIKNYSKAKAKDNRFAFCEEVKNELNLDMEATTIRDTILGPIIRLPKKYNAFKKNAIQGKEQTFTEFKEYLKNKAPSDNNRLYNSGNGELLAYTIETFKKYVPEFKEEFVFAEDTIADANTIGKERKKTPSIGQSYEDAFRFIDYYIDNNIINSKQTTKEIYSALFEANRESNPNENHVSIGTVERWRSALNKIKETLEQDPNKTDQEIKNDVKNKYHHKNMCCILGQNEIFSRAINKLRALNKTTNDNIIEESDNDNYYIDSDSLQANIASIKRMHELDSSEPKAMKNTKDTPNEINMFETKRQHLFSNYGVPILPNLNNKTAIPMPQAMDNFENEKRLHLSEQSPSGDDNNIGNIFTPISFNENHVPLVINYDSQAIDNDNKSIKEKDDSQNNYDETTPLIGHDDDMLYGTSFFNDNVPQFINNDTDFFTDLENLFPVQPSNTNASTSFDNIDIDKVSSNKNLLPNSNNQIGLSSENSSSGNINAEQTPVCDSINNSKKRERQKITPQTQKMMIAYSLFKGYYNTREITNNINKDLNITVTGKSMYNILTPMQKLVNIYNLFKNDDNCKDLPKTIENFHAYVMKVIDEYLKDKPIINKEEIFYFTVAAMANVFEGNFQFENSLNLEEANKEVEMYFNELKYRGIKNDIILT